MVDLEAMMAVPVAPSSATSTGTLLTVFVKTSVLAFDSYPASLTHPYPNTHKVDWRPCAARKDGHGHGTYPEDSIGRVEFKVVSCFAQAVVRRLS